MSDQRRQAPARGDITWQTFAGTRVSFTPREGSNAIKSAPGGELTAAENCGRCSGGIAATGRKGGAPFNVYLSTR